MDTVKKMGRTVLVWGLPADMATETLRQRLSKFGTVGKLTFPCPARVDATLQPALGSCAEVEMATADDALQLVKKLDRQRIGKALLLVRRLVSLAETPKALKGCELIVRNLSFNATQLELASRPCASSRRNAQL